MLTNRFITNRVTQVVKKDKVCINDKRIEGKNEHNRQRETDKARDFRHSSLKLKKLSSKFTCH